MLKTFQEEDLNTSSMMFPSCLGGAASNEEDSDMIQSLLFGMDTKTPLDSISTSPLSSSLPSEVNNFSMSIQGIPEEGIKSRAENIIRITLHWTMTPSEYISSFPLLRQNSGSIPSAPTMVKLPRQQMSPLSIVLDLPEPGAMTLTAHVVSVSNRETPLVACKSCVLRERRKLIRKQQQQMNKMNNISSNLCTTIFKDYQQVMDLDPNPEELVRILTFTGNTTSLPIEHLDKCKGLSCRLQVGFRLTCYTRHHPLTMTPQSQGFRVCFQLRSSTGELMFSAMTPPIIITDDHKRSNSSSMTGIGKRINSALSTHVGRLLTPPPTPIDCSEPVPIISKTIPHEGPVQGGIEITMVGINLPLFDTIPFKVWFGTCQAHVLQCISREAMIVRLPPGINLGPVPVTLTTENVDFGCNTQTPIFLYKSDLDASMMELALQLIGLRLSGRLEDPREVALRIIQSENQTGLMTKTSPLKSSSSSSIEHLLLGLFATSDDIIWNTQSTGGHTLAHLALFNGMHQLAEQLVIKAEQMHCYVNDQGLSMVDLLYLLSDPDQQADRWSMLLTELQGDEIEKATSSLLHPGTKRAALKRFLKRCLFPSTSAIRIRRRGEANAELLIHQPINDADIQNVSVDTTIVDKSNMPSASSSWLHKIRDGYLTSRLTGRLRVRDLFACFAWLITIPLIMLTRVWTWICQKCWLIGCIPDNGVYSITFVCMVMAILYYRFFQSKCFDNNQKTKMQSERLASAETVK